jgi:hypothetical protein
MTNEDLTALIAVTFFGAILLISAVVLMGH